MAATSTDVFVYSLATFLGNVGVAVSGFGMAIVYLFVWQICVLCGWQADFKYAVFIQAIGLFAAQPLLIYQADVRQHGSRRLLQLFVPVTILSTPLGQFVGLYIDAEFVQMVGGIIVSVFATFEIYRNRRLIAEALGCEVKKQATKCRSGDARKESSEEGEDTPYEDIEKEKVFFMIGSQRSGSNWLRSMVNEREDIAGPHPPHIFDNFVPLLDKFGDLGVQANRDILVDHILTFVERNQVPWTDKKGNFLNFDRKLVNAEVQQQVDEEGTITGLDLIMVVFNHVYDTVAQANYKRTWICKSMGMAKYHDTLLKFYGKDRLRYIYLIRDPRDVAMSFMNTPVGDCHYYEIARKWCKLQDIAVGVVKDYPDLVHVMRYEELLLDKPLAMAQLFEYLGGEKFARPGSVGSVMEIRDLETKCEEAKSGDEAKKAAGLSKQFSNLVLGADFAATQHQKWLTGKPPMPREDLILVENVAHQTMKNLEYEPAVVTVTQDPEVFTEAQIAEFDRLNKEAIKKMNKDLMEEDPGDAMRRIYQAEVLSMPAELIPEELKRRDAHPAKEIEQEVTEVVTMQLPDGYTLRCAALTQAGFHPIKKVPNQDTFAIKDRIAGVDSHWLAVFDGHGPKGKECSHFARDNLKDFIVVNMSGGPEAGPARVASLAPAGSKAAAARVTWSCIPRAVGFDAVVPCVSPARSALKLSKSAGQTAAGPSLLEQADVCINPDSSPNTSGPPPRAATEVNLPDILKTLHVAVNDKLQESEVDDKKSGTTAISVLLQGRVCHIANVGDSCCMRGYVENGFSLAVECLSKDQTPYREDERVRIKACGAIVATPAQLDGTEPMHEQWVEGQGGQPRVWAPGQKYPGCAFTRSIGDASATPLGVVAEPEMMTHVINRNDRVLVLCSDGITQYLTPQDCVNMTMQFDDPVAACEALVQESRKRWLDNEDRVDDITAMVAYVEPPEMTGMQARDSIALLADGVPNRRSMRRRSKESRGASKESRRASQESSRLGSKESGASMGSIEFAVATESDEIEEPARLSKSTEEPEYKNLALWSLSMGFLSGFLGGLCGIRGPPIILFFLHMSFPKHVTKANGATITLFNISMRVIYYVIDAILGDLGDDLFVPEDWPLYASVVLISPVGVAVGGQIFARMKDSQAKIKTMLAFLLVLAGISLLITAFDE